MTGDLERLAAAHGIATSYENHRHAQVAAPAETVRAVLAALGVPAETPDEVTESLRAAEERPWRRLVPPTVVGVQGERTAIDLRLPVGVSVDVRLELEAGGVRALDVGPIDERHELDGDARVRRTGELPPELPTGYHRLQVRAGDAHATALAVVAPARCPQLPHLPPVWGWMLQLYALRSSDSWGIGELADLRQLATWSADAGAGFVLCNPLHAATPVPPLEDSPYYPSSRRFLNPLYLRIEDLPELDSAPPAVHARVERLAARAREGNLRDRIDRDEVWRAKAEALELLRAVPTSRARSRALREFREAGGRALEDFALYCALAEREGASWRDWPAGLRHPDSPAVDHERTVLTDRVAFHTWLQFCCHEQLADAHTAALGAGMPLGLLADLAVGVGPDGADAWALQAELASGVTIGAPPDAFNQQGQDWQLPPLRPDRLHETGFAAFRSLLAPALAHAGGIRIDHVLGLFRLWWIPKGAPPTAGCYVHYPVRDLLAVLALEATRAGDALVVGEDLGAVAPELREQLDVWGVFSSRVVYFERAAADDSGGRRRLRADDYPERALASVTTHDLPTVAGWWADEDVRVQAELGLLADDTSPEAERGRKERERADMVELLMAEGLLEPRDTEDPAALRMALHAFLARTRARLVAAQPADAVGDLRQPNQPGTVDEYPNWRLPVAEPTPSGHRPLLLDELLGRPELRALTHTLTEGRAAR